MRLSVVLVWVMACYGGAQPTDSSIHTHLNPQTRSSRSLSVGARSLATAAASQASRRARSMGLFNRSKKKGKGASSSAASPSSASSTDPHSVSTPASSSDGTAPGAATQPSMLSPGTERRAAKEAEGLAVRVQALRQKVEAEKQGGQLDNARKRALYYEVRWGWDRLRSNQSNPSINPSINRLIL